MRILRDSKDLIIRAMVAHVYYEATHVDKIKAFEEMKRETDSALVARIIRELTTKVKVDPKIFFFLPRVLQPKDIIKIKEVRVGLTLNIPTNVVIVNFLQQTAQRFSHESDSVRKSIKKGSSNKYTQQSNHTCRTSRESPTSWLITNQHRK